jgi:hypothetical protein
LSKYIKKIEKIGSIERRRLSCIGKWGRGQWIKDKENII